jgi:hypothetical protein
MLNRFMWDGKMIVKHFDTGDAAVSTDPTVIPAPDPTPDPEPEKFDPSKVDVADSEALSSLTQPQLKEVEQFLDTNAPTVEKPDKDTSATGTPSSEPAPKKYADKYETSDALAEGVSEAAKKLGWSEKYTSSMIEQAKTSKDFGALENAYKIMEGAISSGLVLATSPVNPDADPTRVVTPVQTDTSIETLKRVTELTLESIEASPLAQKFANEGLTIPRTAEEVEALWESSPKLAIQFREYWKGTFDNIKGELLAFQAAKVESETHNKKLFDSAETTIKQLADKVGLKLTDAEIKAEAEKIKSTEDYYAVKNGSKYLKDSVLRDHFFARVLPDRFNSVLREAEARGAVKGVTRIEENRRSMPSTISSTMAPSRDRQQKAIDYTDVDQLSSLSDAQLDELTPGTDRLRIRK